MERKGRSLRGETVNFDLFAIKEQMSEAPINAKIEQREKFINLRKRRGGRRVLNDMLANSEAAATESVDSSEIAFEAVEDDAVEEPKPSNRKIVKKEAK